MKFLVEGIAILVFCYICWKVFGRDLATFLAKDAVNEVREIEEDETVLEMKPEKSQRQQDLEDKIEDLKLKAEELKLSTDELKVTKMLEEIMKQLKEKETELEKLDTNIWLNKK